MLKVLLHRLLLSIPLVFVVTFLTFFLNSLSPGDLAQTMLGADGTREQYIALRADLGLDKPLLLQYGQWLWRALQGDLGVSFFTQEKVVTLLNNRMGVTLSIMLGVLVVAISLGLLLGVVSALRGGWLGRAVDAFSLLGMVFPSFFVALLLILVFAVTLRWLPATGYTMFSENPWAWAQGLVLPVMASAFIAVTNIAKQTRDAMNDVMGRDFIRALRACGVSERSVVWKHGLRNAALPVVTVFGIVMVTVISNTVFVERIFVLPGIGSLASTAVQTKDIAVLQGAALYYTLSTVVINLLVDLSYSWLNPKLRFV